MSKLRYDEGDVFVSTVVAFDTGQWETAVGHPDYNDGLLIIVETYDYDEAAAKRGHTKWVKAMTSSPLPASLPSRPNDPTSSIVRSVIDLPTSYPRKEKPNV